MPVRTAAAPLKILAMVDLAVSGLGRGVPICAYEKMAESPQVSEKNWRPRRDLNPRYRRERALPVRNLLKRRDADGYRRHVQ